MKKFVILGAIIIVALLVVVFRLGVQWVPKSKFHEEVNRQGSGSDIGRDSLRKSKSDTALSKLKVVEVINPSRKSMMDKETKNGGEGLVRSFPVKAISHSLSVIKSKSIGQDSIKPWDPTKIENWRNVGGIAIKKNISPLVVMRVFSDPFLEFADRLYSDRRVIDGLYDTLLTVFFEDGYINHVQLKRFDGVFSSEYGSKACLVLLSGRSYLKGVNVFELQSRYDPGNDELVVLVYHGQTKKIVRWWLYPARKPRIDVFTSHETLYYEVNELVRKHWSAKFPGED